jgi:MOSC domain-containing protein YiiM
MLLPPALTGLVLDVRAGRVAALGPDGVLSGIRKASRLGRVSLDHLGIVGDEHADTRHHGGPDKALHLYPAEHYDLWRRELPELAERFTAGAFGENLSTQGLREADLCLGDVFAVGAALLQVSQGRQPCAKLNLQFEHADMVARVLATRRTGVYLRVLVPGDIAAGDCMRLIERPVPDWPLTRVWDALFVDPGTREELSWLAGQPCLSASWRERAARRLAEAGPG